MQEYLSFCRRGLVFAIISWLLVGFYGKSEELNLNVAFPKLVEEADGQRHTDTTNIQIQPHFFFYYLL